jgi:hypothetical protein
MREQGMLDNRRYPRDLVLKTGQIELPEQPAIACAILNIGKAGACVLVPERAGIPDAFDLRIDPTAGVRRCRVVWRDGPKIGFEFVDGEPLK